MKDYFTKSLYDVYLRLPEDNISFPRQALRLYTVLNTVKIQFVNVFKCPVLTKAAFMSSKIQYKHEYCEIVIQFKLTCLL